MVIIINVFIYSCGCPVTVCRTGLASQTRGQRVLNVCYDRYLIYVYMSTVLPIPINGGQSPKVFILKNNSSY